MKAITLDDVRLTLHILAATVWVGGQLTLAALVPVLRRSFPDATAPVARRFAVVAWWAFAALVLTGAWNMQEYHTFDHGQRVALMVKLGLVLLSGLAALVHQRARGTALMAVSGALALLAALAVVLFGVVVAG